MALSKLQSDILRLLAKNRSESSYLAGGLMLNKDWRRRSDDIDIFHDTDEEVTETAKGLPADWSAGFIRDEVLRLTDAADTYVMSAPSELTSLLAVNKDGVPIEVSDANRMNMILRKATEEPEVMPAPADFNAVGWTSDRP